MTTCGDIKFIMFVQWRFRPCIVFDISKHIWRAAGLARTLRELPSAEAIALRTEVNPFVVVLALLYSVLCSHHCV